MEFSHILIEWYRANKRDLPWRLTSDPYKIWVSEVILQQTRVAQGLGYFLRFTETFPSVFDLADAHIDKVLKVWQGLGYYTRARNMHATAKYIVENLNGNFPNTYAELIKLKGVGDYTASAIATFAFKERVAAIDGNVYRIMARYFGVDTPMDTSQGQKELRALAQNAVDEQHPDVYNQAIMDFGGTLCMPKSPKCYECPFIESCAAFRNRRVEEFPVKIKKVKQTVRYFTYLIVEVDGKTLISRRSEADIWHSLYEFPLIETDQMVEVEELAKHKRWKEIFANRSVEVVSISKTIKYVLSHQKIFARFIVVKASKLSAKVSNTYNVVEFEEIHSYSTPRLIEGYIAAESIEKYFTKKHK